MTCRKRYRNNQEKIPVPEKKQEYDWRRKPGFNQYLASKNRYRKGKLEREKK